MPNHAGIAYTLEFMRILFEDQLKFSHNAEHTETQQKRHCYFNKDLCHISCKAM